MATVAGTQSGDGLRGESVSTNKPEAPEKIEGLEKRGKVTCWILARNPACHLSVSGIAFASVSM
jgi:hypothetical protein